MSVWFCIPSKRPPEQARPVLEAWRDMGYKIALCVDSADDVAPGYVNLMISSPDGYRGYARSTNALIAMVVEKRDARWCVIGGDDVFPDPTKRADEIARECQEEFWYRATQATHHDPSEVDDSEGTFGVMQPTGDPWADGMGRIIERIAGSAWIGREFALRAYGGNGPLWPEYRHMFPDEELQCVAQKLGVFWQRPDLTQRHKHWARKVGATKEDMPEFLAEANSAAHWAKYKAIFQERKAAGFPGHEVKP